MSISAKSFRTTPLKILLVIIVVLVSAYPVAVYVRYKVKKNNYTKAYANLEIGMSDDFVKSHFGLPTEISICDTGGGSPKGCHRIYWYYVTMERWGIYLDQEGKVIDKVHNVSY